jgi:hypothetical protein
MSSALRSHTGNNTPLLPLLLSRVEIGYPWVSRCQTQEAVSKILTRHHVVKSHLFVPVLGVLILIVLFWFE